MIVGMSNQHEALRILRRAGETQDDKVDLGEAALALAALDKKDCVIEPYRQHLAALVEQVRAENPAARLDDQLRAVRRVLVVQNKYQGDENHKDEARASNLMDVIDRRSGSPVALGLLYLHIAAKLGWAMTGLDLTGHFLIRLSAPDGQAVIDPFRAGQLCQIIEADEDYFDEDDALFDELPEADPRILDLSAELMKPLTAREVLLRLQHGVKRRFLSQDRVDAAITTLQSMILFAPRHEELWRELSTLQAERGHIRAAITALEVVRDLAGEPLPVQQTDGMLRELRWRLN